MPTSLLHFISILLSLSLLTSPIHAAESEDSPNEFVNPPAPGYQFDYTKNPTYAIGAPVPLQWRTTYTNLTLVLWQFGNSTNQTLLENVPAVTRWDWRADLTGLFSLESSNIFSFTVYDTGRDADDTIVKNQFASHYFNLTDSGSDSSSTATTSATSSATAPGNSSASSSFEGLSEGTKIGIGVGVGVGAAIFLAAIGILFFRRRNQSSRQQHTGTLDLTQLQSQQPFLQQQQQQQYAPYTAGVGGVPESAASSMAKSPQELPVGNQVLELGATPGGEERQELPADMEQPRHFRWGGKR
ncbi:hypothetical protein LTR37_021078 [Vermiconidia calcicola]|uniref:Uncharacterized protein n=1 Tax=Vermiconidia calcicola TaxID=1690605 RepID=A0ACC3MAU2_9PEZI|nr:hypothetical protein LTR37_021078 [Vermiconidia calcicola]